MKRSIAATIALAFFMLVLLMQTSASTAQKSPVPTATLDTAVAVSPLATPLPHWEPSYNPHPKKITPPSVPFFIQSEPVAPHARGVEFVRLSDDALPRKTT
jgi:hypothetical protein